MKFLTAKSQFTVGLVCLQVSVLCTAMLFGLVPDQKSAVMKGRADLCETLAVTSSQLMGKGRAEDLSVLLHEVVERNSQILSAAVRKSDGTLVEEIGDHDAHWQRDGLRSSENEVLVPIQASTLR